MIGTFIHYEEKSSAQRIKGSDNGSTASYRKTLTLRISLVYKSDRCRKMASWWVTTVRPCVAMQFRLGNAGCVSYLGHTSHTNARTITKMVNNGRSLTYNTKRKKKKKYISLWTSSSTYQYKEGSRPEIRSPGLADSSLFPSTLVPPHIAWYWNFTAKRSIVIKYSTSLRLSCREGLLCEIRVERDRQAIVTLISLCSRLSTALKESMNELALTRLVTR